MCFRTRFLDGSQLGVQVPVGGNVRHFSRPLPPHPFQQRHGTRAVVRLPFLQLQPVVSRHHDGQGSRRMPSSRLLDGAIGRKTRQRHPGIRFPLGLGSHVPLADVRARRNGYQVIPGELVYSFH